MRRSRTLLAVWITSIVTVLLCVGWAFLVDHVVPTACSYATPPTNANYLHCPTPSGSPTP